MALKKIEINESDWTGRTTTLTVNEKTGFFQIASRPGERFRLVIHKNGGEFRSASVFHGNEKERMFGGIVFDGVWSFSSCGVERECPNPFEAAAQVVLNVL